NTRYYDNQTDNYHQQNYQVLLTQQLSENWNLHAALFYTKGAGYYEQYKTGRTLTDYGLTPFYNKDGEKIKKTDLVRRKQMENDFGGMIASIHYQNKVVDATVGGGINRYVGDHFGEITWVKNYVGALQPNERYYDNQGRKTDANIYAKATYLVAKGLNLYADLQYRYLNYQISGANDNFDWNTGAMQQLDVNDSFHFFNPKVGINWQISNQHRLFASFSVAQKEPTRNNYTDGMFTVYPKSERLNDYEMGYQFKSERFSAGANLYYMDYKDQLVLTGQLNEIGEAMAANMPNSYRMGVELMGSALLAKNLTLHLNATFSKNRIQDFTEVIYEDGWKNPIETQLGDTPIAFSPDMLLNGSINYTLGAFDMVWQTQYVSKQYMSNSKNEQQVLDAYNVSNFSLNYHFSLPHIKRVSVGVTLYNVFDEEYENNGWAYSKYEVKAGKNVRVDQAGYAAQAGTHLMGHLSLSF
ncbi:MAG: TonB-dependent receptor, partial [Bacteroidaceae bacterium]